jgi:hypothetical protein
MNQPLFTFKWTKWLDYMSFCKPSYEFATELISANDTCGLCLELLNTKL